MNGLMLHCGGCAATLDQIDAVPTPDPTDTHFPIPHGKLIRQVRGQLLDAGIRIEEEAYGLSHEGARVFGVLTLEAEHLPTIQGSQLALGIRNSHDKSFVAGLALGNRVFCCDNLSFLGTRTLARKHTRFAERDLPALIARILGSLGEWAGRQAELIETYAGTMLTDEQAHDLMIQTVRAGVIAPSRLAHVIEAWHRDERPEPRHLWTLFNNYTEALKGTLEIPELARRTERLHGLADLAVSKIRQLPAPAPAFVDN